MHFPLFGFQNYSLIFTLNSLHDLLFVKLLIFISQIRHSFKIMTKFFIQVLEIISTDLDVSTALIFNSLWRRVDKKSISISCTSCTVYMGPHLLLPPPSSHILSRCGKSN